MKLDKITLQFTAEELEAIHYAMDIGIIKHRSDKCEIAKDWIDMADKIRQKLPIQLRFRTHEGNEQ